VARTHIIGAGLAGLSAAVQLCKAGRDVSLHEGAGHAGGRCRSFFDETLERRIDNGNHLLLSGNKAALGYLKDIGAEDSLVGPGKAAFPFLDLASNERWTVAMGKGIIPWWIFSKSRRVPGSRPLDYLAALKLAWAGDEATVAGCLDTSSALYRKFLEPLAVAVLNTGAEEGAACLLWPVIRETFGRGEAASRPLIAKDGLSESFVDPALNFLLERGVEVSFNQRLREFRVTDDNVTGLAFATADVTLGDEDQVILATPPAVAANLVAGLQTPTDSRAIVNGHFRLDGETGDISFLGLVGGVSQWLFVRGDMASVTVSAADDLADDDADDIAARLWAEVAAALDLGAGPLGKHRIVKEKRATFAQTPEQVKLRRHLSVPWKNLCLAGDWTNTGLPATIEGSIRSGVTASETVLFSKT